MPDRQTAQRDRHKQRHTGRGQYSLSTDGRRVGSRRADRLPPRYMAARPTPPRRDKSGSMDLTSHGEGRVPTSCCQPNHGTSHQTESRRTQWSAQTDKTISADGWTSTDRREDRQTGRQISNMASTSSFGLGPPAAWSISRAENATQSTGFSNDACRLRVSWRLAHSERLRRVKSPSRERPL